MKKNIGNLLRIIFVFLAICFFLFGLFSLRNGISKGERINTKSLIVQTKNISAISNSAEIISDEENLYLVKFDSFEDTKDAYRKLSKDDKVEKVISNDLLTTTEDIKESEYAELKISKEIKEIKYKDDDYVIALIDTGVSDNCSNIKDKVSIIEEDANYEYSHGSKMADVITKENPEAEILSIKAMDKNGHGSVESIYKAIEYAIDANVDIINLSLSGYSNSDNDLLKSVIEKAKDEGIIVVGSAGNRGKNVEAFIPGNIDDVIVVGSSDSQGIRNSFSNYGKSVDYYIEAENTSIATAKMAGKLSRYNANVYDYQGVIAKLIADKEVFDNKEKYEKDEIIENMTVSGFNADATVNLVLGSEVEVARDVGEYTYQRLILWTTAKLTGYTIDANNVVKARIEFRQYLRAEKKKDGASVPIQWASDVLWYVDGTNVGTKIFPRPGEMVVGTSNERQPYDGSSANWVYSNPTSLWYDQNLMQGPITFEVSSGTRNITTADIVFGQDITSNEVNFSISVPYAVLLQYHMNGGALASAHGTDISSSGNYVTVNGSKIITTIINGNSLTGNGLPDYNNSTYINIARTGYRVADTSKIFQATINGTTKYFNQTTNYSSSDFGGASGSNKVVDLKINWTANTYTIAYTLNGGTQGSSHPTSATYDQEVNISNPTRTGYTFAGWTMTGGNGSTAKYGTASGSVTTSWSTPTTTKVKAQYFKNLTPTNGGTVTLVANWTANTYTVEYYQGNNSSTAGATLLGTSTHTYGTAKNLTSYSSFSSTLPSSKPNSTWSFAGWCTPTPSLTITYTDGQSVNNLTTTNGGKIQLYAIFKRNITFYSGVNKATTNTVEQKYNPYRTSDYLTTVTVPSLRDISGWTASGYRINTTAAAATTSAGATITPAYDATAITYYGVYSKAYTANFYSGVSKATNNPKTGSAYYNTNTTAVPTTTTITVQTAANSTDITSWTESGWRDDTTAGAKEYDYGQASVSVTIGTSNFYSIYTRTLTVSYNGNGNTGGSTANTTKTIYLNANSTTTSSQSITARANGFTKTGYTFSGWNTAANGSGTAIAASGSYNPNVAYNATTFGGTLYAQWTVNTYTIEYYQGNNTTTAGSTLLGSSNHTYGSAKTLTLYGGFVTKPSSVPNSTWSFAGWSTAQDGTTINYTDGQSVTSLTSTNGGVVKLYAVFKRNITFYSGVNKATTNNVEQRYNPYKTTGSITSVTPPALTAISGWTSLGYRNNTTADAATVTVGTAITPTYNATAILYYGVYSKAYTANFYSGINKATNNPITGTVYYNTNTTAVPTTTTITTQTAANSADITSWTESGWKDDTTAGAKEYDYGQASVSVTIGTSNFYSIYTRTLTVSYNGNGNTGGSTANTTKTIYLNANSTATSSQSITARANGFTKIGYTFSGWNTAANGSGTAIAASGSYNPNVAYNATTFGGTLYAQWSPISYIIGYTLNNGTHGSSHPTSATYDQVVNISNPTRNGYTFAGWTMSNGNTSTAMYGTSSGAVTSAWSDASTKVTAQYFKNLTATSGATVTLVANWTANTYQVTYNGNGGTQLVNSNLVGKYDGYFNNGNTHSTSTTSWPDISGNNKNGTITNGTWGTDHLIFDGTTWVNFGQMKSDYQTIEVTFSIDALKSSSQYIIGNWESGGGGIYVTNAGIITGQFYIGGAWKSLTFAEPMIPEKIYHVALTYDGTTERLYVNGVEKASLSITGVIGPPSNSTIMAMGGNPARSTVSSPTLSGKIYNAAVYNTALTATQIANDGGKVVTYTSTYGTLPDAARAGYTFKGWYNQPSGGTKITSSSTVSTIGDHMLYAQWTAIPVTISIKKDNANWNANSGVKIELRQSGNTKYSATASSNSVSISPVVAGTYDIYASKDANNLTTLVDTGIDVAVTSTGTATIDYYTLTLNKGVGISAVSGAGTYLKNQSANIDATVSNGYTWQGWSVVSGDSPN